MTYKVRIREAVKQLGLVKVGSVFNMHYSILGFGHEKKPFHYSVSINHFDEKYSGFNVLPGTSQKNENSFRIRLWEESTVKIEPDQRKETYFLFYIKKNVPYHHLAMGNKNAEHRGKLNDETSKKLLRERRDFILKQRRGK